MTNPFYEYWDTPFGIPPFEKITVSDMREALDEGFRQGLAEVEAIVDQSDEPSFENTIEAFERTGHLLNKVAGVFSNLTSAHTNDELQALQMEVAPRFASHASEIFNNQGLFARVKAVYDNPPALAPDQEKLLKDTFRRFEKAGANLAFEDQASVKAINQELASLMTQFGQNVLKDTNAFELVLDKEDDLAGLPGSVKEAAANEAESRDMKGKYVFTISRSSITPFLQFADKRELREQIYNAYTTCGDNNNDYNNRSVLQKIASLRARRAKILGYNTHAHAMLDDRMAGTPEAVNNLLDEIWAPAKAKVKQEADALQDRIQRDGGNFKLAPWDWFYYTEKLRQEQFDLDDEVVKPYFELEAVRQGAFDVATRLYGITFEELYDVPGYHPDINVYEVSDSTGAHVGVFITDYFMRASKRGGAWMNEFRGQSNLDGSVRPIVVNCCNFPKGSPCLLGMDEVRTLFHEFGHGLHGLMSQVRYESQSGTNVKQDFVELPSQIMEHWAVQPEVMRSYARHYKTGEVIPDELIEKIREAGTFNQGFATTEYLAACYLDMAWHGLETEDLQDVEFFEAGAMAAVDLIDEVDPRYKSTYFQHVFTGEHYSAGYYSYIWAEVLDADGFEAFKEHGIFDEATAQAFRENVLEKGGSVEPMDLYVAFRGREPEVVPLLKNRGLA